MIKRIPILLRLVLLFVLQTGFLGWLIWDRVHILETGQTVRLAVEPVDPRDIFRGYYANLNYEISRIRPATIGATDDFNRHDIVYVSLTEGADGLWHPDAISRDQEQLPSGGVTIAGRVRYVRPNSVTSTDDSELGCANPCQMIVVRYGIEQYFAQQDAATELETAQRDSKVEILAAINTSGKAAIKGIIVDGTLRYEEPLW